MADLSNVREALRGGLTYIGFSAYDANNRLVPLGGTLVAGNTTGSGGTSQLVGAQTFPAPMQPETETIAWVGDDGVIDSLNVESETVPEGIIVVSQYDYNIEAALQGTSVKELGDMASGVLFAKNPSYPKVVVVINQFKSISRKDGAQGLPIAASYVLSNAQLVPLGPANIESRTRSDNNYRLVVGKRSKTPWGVTVNDDYGVCEAGVFQFHPEYPIDIQSWLGNGVVVTYSFGKTPAEASSDKVVVYVNGVLQAYTVDYTVDTAAATITFEAGSTPANGAYIVALYQYTTSCT